MLVNLKMTNLLEDEMLKAQIAQDELTRVPTDKCTMQQRSKWQGSIGYKD